MKKLFAKVLPAVLCGGALCASAYVLPDKVKQAGLEKAGLHTPLLESAEAETAAPARRAAADKLYLKSGVLRAPHALAAETGDEVETVFSADFKNGFDGFTAIDANGDNETWRTSSGQVCMWTNKPADDWLVSPGLELKAGRTYTVTMQIKVMTKSQTETFELKAGTAATAEAMTVSLIGATQTNSGTYEPVTCEFTPATDGVYYIGLHCTTSDGSFGGLYMDDFSVTTPYVAEAEGIEPPFEATFDTALDPFTVIDANNDGTTWRLSSGQACVWTNNPTDDWLVSPGIRLVGGRTYPLSMKIKVMSKSKTETFEMKAGTAATAEAMTFTLMEATETNSQQQVVYTCEFTAPADGVYYFGLHCTTSDTSFGGLYMDDFSISAPAAAPAIPAGATELTATAAPGGALGAVVSFVAPLLTDDGQTLESIDRIEVTRGETLVKTFENPAPGASLSFEDTVDKEGEYTYAVTAYTAAGAGLTVTTEVYIGVDLPAEVKNVAYKETSTPGEVTITWDAVTTDVNGAAIDPSKVTYGVYIVGNQDMTLVAEGITGTSYTYQAVPAGTQKFVQYAVFPVTSKGEGDGSTTDFGPVGTPYTGFSMTVESDLDRYILGLDISGGASVGIYGDTDFDGFTSMEGDDFCLGFYGQYLDVYASIFTGKIALEGMVNPTFSYYLFNLGLDGGYTYDNEVMTEVTDMATGEKAVVATTVASQTGPVDAWNRVAVDLSAYAGKVVSITLKAVCKSAAYTFVDNLSVGSLVDHDLEASNVLVPANVLAGQSFTASVVVKNIGAKAADQYKVSLYCNNTLMETRECTDLASGATTSVEFTVATSPIDTEAKVLYATVESAGDEVVPNNTTPSVTVEVVKSEYPAVTDLQANSGVAGVELTWSEPDLESAPAERITESFEDGDAFSSEFGAWTFVDVDESPVGGISTQDIPGITPGTTKGAFWVWDANLLSDAMTGARTGKKFLFSLFRFDDQKVDDWAISPELCGQAQTIQFYAKSYVSTYREHIEVYYSTTGTEISDFIKIRNDEVVMPYWEEYNVDLPAGAKYFAIRSCATGGFMLSIDDVTFTPAGNANLDLVGYNVYRDGVKLNSEPVEEPEFTDETAEEGKTYTYVVTTIYTKGESAGSNAVDILYDLSGVEVTEVSADEASAEYYSLQGIRIENPAPGTVCIRRQGGVASKVVIK